MSRADGRPFLPTPALYALLVMSIATNVLLVTRLRFPHAIERLRVSMQAPPVVDASDHVRGNAGARGTVIVYTDFQCPFCARQHASMQKLGTGTDVRWVYRHFPLESHPFAFRAAEAAECAGAQGKFWEYSDALFRDGFTIESEASLRQPTAVLGLDSTRFESCLKSGEFAGRVAAQRDDGIRRRINATPTLYVNGKRFDGVLAPDELRQALKQ